MTIYYRHPASFEHDTGAHPENAERIRRIEEALEEEGWPGIERVEAPAATREQLERAHTPEHLDRVERFCAQGGGMIDLDTVASAGSWDAALRSAGGAADAASRLLAGEADAAFCGLRPPGHHAERDRAMGFCLANNAAVAAHQALVDGAERVLILDWDVHHGNGTEEIFRESRSVLYASIHQDPLYPGTGPASYEGEGEGRGFTLNLPVQAGAGSEEFLSLVQHVVLPVGRDFRPGLIIVSAGYDAHRDDPLASCMVEDEGYRQMTLSVRKLAGEVNAAILVCLEGGYDPDALARSVVVTLDALGDSAEPEVADESFSAGFLARVPG